MFGLRIRSSPRTLIFLRSTCCRTGKGIHLDVAVDYVVKRIEELKKLFPDKPIVISKLAGLQRKDERGRCGFASNEATFLRRFLDRAEKEKLCLLRYGGLRSAVEAAERGIGRRILGSL
jgi:hypothetical protein